MTTAYSSKIGNPFGTQGRRGLGPTGDGKGGQPSTAELRWTAWGFLMAAVWFADPKKEPPTQEYLQALADLRQLKVPTMAVEETNTNEKTRKLPTVEEVAGLMT